MKQLGHINSVDPLKILGDARRLAILRLLMVEPATLSQLGRALKSHPANVRHHLKLLEEVGLVELISTRVVGGFVEKYYQASARSYMVNLALVPEHGKRVNILAFGSHDIALELLASQTNQASQDAVLVPLPVGSLDGLIALRQGLGQVAGCHLFDEVSGEFNRDYVRHLFPGRQMLLFTLTHREQGLLVASGNPKEILTIDDLARPDVTIVNRQPGSGTRLWLDRALAEEGISAADVQGYELVADTHLSAGQAITRGDADVGLGLLAAARHLDLDFIPLFEERYDLVLPAESAADPLFQPLLNHMQSASFRQSIRQLGGYDTQQTGDIVEAS